VLERLVDFRRVLQAPQCTAERPRWAQVRGP
jgi:hypothetical protein